MKDTEEKLEKVGKEYSELRSQHIELEHSTLTFRLRMFDSRMDRRKSARWFAIPSSVPGNAGCPTCAHRLCVLALSPATQNDLQFCVRSS